MCLEMKIAIVTAQYPPCDGPNGIAVYSRMLAEGLARRGHEVHVIAHADPLEAPASVSTQAGVTVHRINEPAWSRKCRMIKVLINKILIRRTVRQIAKERGLDVVEAPNWVFEGLFLAWGRRSYRLVCRMHTPMFEQFKALGKQPSLRYRIMCRLEKFCVRSADALVTSTRYYARKMADAYALDLERIACIPLGIELPPEQAINPEPEHPWVDVLFTGRLEERKGTQYLLEAVPRVLEARAGVRFIFAGLDRHDHYQKRFWERNPNISPDRVVFCGFVTDAALKDHYRDCDIFIAPSLSESFGLIFIEAMAWGKPVVACDVCAVSEVVEHGTTGLLAPPRDAEKLAEAVIALVDDRDRRLAMGRASRARVEERFSASRFIQEMEGFYQETGKRE